MGSTTWLIPAAAVLLGGGGIASILGLLVNRQQNRMVNNATGAGQAIDGLTKLTQEQRAELDRAYERIAALEAQLKGKGSK